MNINPDYLIERKRDKRQIIKWKLFSLMVIIFLLFNLGNKLQLPSASNFGPSMTAAQKDRIASIKIQEIIFDDLERVKNLAALAEDKSVKALLVNINSPGGSVVGSEMLYNTLKKIAKSKPVVVVMGSLAASGGYLIALGGDYIVAHNGTLTGSIGVIMQSAEVTELAERLGIKFDNFKSDALKASPNPTEKVTPEVRQATMESIYQVYDYFIEQVALRRKLDLNYVRKIADGRVYSGRQALELKLVDAIGDQDTALEWLYTVKNIPKTLDIVDTKLKPKERFIDVLLEDFQTKIASYFQSGFAGFKALIWQ
ncbi:MAG: signal peptide peptidase SppA [Rickettsiaceae bacterium]